MFRFYTTSYLFKFYTSQKFRFLQVTENLKIDAQTPKHIYLCEVQICSKVPPNTWCIKVSPLLISFLDHQLIKYHSHHQNKRLGTVVQAPALYQVVRIYNYFKQKSLTFIQEVLSFSGMSLQAEDDIGLDSSFCPLYLMFSFMFSLLKFLIYFFFFSFSSRNYFFFLWCIFNNQTDSCFYKF